MVQASWVALLGHNVIVTGIDIYDGPGDDDEYVHEEWLKIFTLSLES